MESCLCLRSLSASDFGLCRNDDDAHGDDDDVEEEEDDDEACHTITHPWFTRACNGMSPKL